MKPYVQRRRDTLQLSYDLPHRIFSTKVYPCLSPNRSTIIAYGHQEGLRILWRGGRPFKNEKHTEERPKVNGTRKDQAVMIDLDDDQPASNTSTSQPAEFEDEDLEVDPSSPYRGILRHIDISLGTSARHISVPHFPSNISQIAPGAYPPILSTHIVVAATCADSSICLVSLPLTPPSPGSNDPSSWSIQTLKILGSNNHQALPSSIAITHTAAPVESDDEAGQSKSRSQSRSRLTRTTGTSSVASNNSKAWSFLVATTSPTAGGVLLIHQIPLNSASTFSSSPEIHVPIQRQHLGFSTSGSSILFNTSAYPVERHSNVLISIPDTGCVKVYQTLADFSSPSSRGRRGSAATLDSAASGSNSTRGLSGRPGRFLITLYPGFTRPTDKSPSPRRKRIIDVSWVLGGCAILALLEDGEWGVWDIEGAGPSASSAPKGLLSGQTNSFGVQGGALARFAISGRISSGAQEVPKTQHPGLNDAQAGQLAPMTPHTRKLRSDGLFRGNNITTATLTDRGEYVHGYVSVSELASATSSTSSAASDESILLSYGGTNVSIPSLLSFWNSETSGRGTLDSATAGRPALVGEVNLGGERQISIAELSHKPKHIDTDIFGLKRDAVPDILIATEHRIIMVVTAISEPVNTISGDGDAAKTLAQTSSNQEDNLLLSQGDLDIEGMDRILDGMLHERGAAVNGIAKRVGFEVDVDGDVGMGTPTPKINGRLGRRGRNPSYPSKGGGGRLFT